MPAYFCSPQRNTIGGRFQYCPKCEANYDPISSLPHSCRTFKTPPSEERVREMFREMFAEAVKPASSPKKRKRKSIR